jgi:hypothetical protein
MKKLILFFCLFSVFLSCEKYNIPAVPQKAILGKWQCIECTEFSGNTRKNSPSKNDWNYDFFADGTYKTWDYDYEENKLIEVIRKYRIDSLYLYTNLDGYNDTIEKFNFYKDKLQLEIVSGNMELSMGTCYKFVYQRMK